MCYPCSEHNGPIIVMGDFNAHLSGDNKNGQGQLVESMCAYLDLYPVSLSELHSGPEYTFYGGNHHTTVDYFLLDCQAAQLVQKK